MMAMAKGRIKQLFVRARERLFGKKPQGNQPLTIEEYAKIRRERIGGSGKIEAQTRREIMRKIEKARREKK